MAGAVAAEQRAIALRQRHRFVDMALVVRARAAWERQLNALINLQPAVNVEVVQGIAPGLADRLGRRTWACARSSRASRSATRRAAGAAAAPLGLKRLAEEAAELDFLTAQDVQVAGTIGAYRYYSGTGTRYEFDLDKAVAALAGHPLLFWMDAPGTRVELLPGEPQLLVRAGGGKVTHHAGPAAARAAGRGRASRSETPTRLRIVRIKRRAPAHRRHRRRRPGGAAGSREARAAGDQRDLVDRHRAVGHRRQRGRHRAGGGRPAPARASAALPAGLAHAA